MCKTTAHHIAQDVVHDDLYAVSVKGLEVFEDLQRRQYPTPRASDPRLRPAVRRMTVSRLPGLVVLNYNEITRDTKIESVGSVKWEVRSEKCEV